MCLPSTLLKDAEMVKWKKGMNTFWNLHESFTPFCNSVGVLDLDVLSYESSTRYKNMIATLE